MRTLEITITSNATAVLDDDEITCEAGHIYETIYKKATERAHEVGTTVPVRVTSPTGGDRRLLVYPDGTVLNADEPTDTDDGPDAVPVEPLTELEEQAQSAAPFFDSGTDRNRKPYHAAVFDKGLRYIERSAGEAGALNNAVKAIDDAAPHFSVPASSRLAVPNPVPDDEEEPVDRFTPRKPTRRPRQWTEWQKRAAIGAVVGALAFGLGAAACGSGGSESSAAAVTPVIDMYSGNGPGDRTSGPGVIMAYDYAYYVQRDGASALQFWSEGKSDVTGSDLQIEIDAVDPLMRHRLDITETRDPYVYDVLLTLTTPDGINHPYQQQFSLAKNDGRYSIESKITCNGQCPTP